ncbi:MAG: hypothetical protein E5W57_07995 [Mesorhizobium sp.]|nr:MAG: hypothetical protein E5W57_07995 [Mesorhizobium sp.]
MPAPTDAAADWSGWRLGHAIAARFVGWAVDTEGSSRSSALIRVGLAMLFWSRWAGELLLYRDQSPAGLFLAANFFVATALLFVGYRSRVAAIWTGSVGLAMYYYFGFQLGREPWTHHHTYLLAVAALLIALTPCGRSYSLDRHLALQPARGARRLAGRRLGRRDDRAAARGGRRHGARGALRVLGQGRTRRGAAAHRACRRLR